MNSAVAFRALAILTFLAPISIRAEPLEYHESQMALKGVVTFGNDKVEKIHVNGSAFLDGTHVSKVVKVEGNLEAFEADIHTLKMHGTGHLKKSSVQLRARVNGDLKAEDTVFKDGITATSGHLVLSHVISGPVEFKHGTEEGKERKLTLTNGTMINGPVVFDNGPGEIFKDSTSKITGEIVGKYTMHEIKSVAGSQ